MIRPSREEFKARARSANLITVSSEILADLETRYGPTDKRLLPVLSQRLSLYESAGNKKQAKKIAGNSLFVDRREIPDGPLR